MIELTQNGYISGTGRVHIRYTQVHIRYTYGTYQVHSGYTSGTWVDWLGQYCLRRRRNLPRGFILVLEYMGGGAPFEKLELAFRNELTQTWIIFDVGIRDFLT